MRNGLRNSEGILKAAARAAAKSALEAAQSTLGVSSPSKEFAKIGKYSDEGLANGIGQYSKIVKNASSDVAKDALKESGKSMGDLSSLLSEDVDAEPVIRPVVDLSDVSSSARAVNGMFSRSQTMAIDTSVKKTQSISGQRRRVASIQNGSTSQVSTQPLNADSSVNLSGNNFYIRSEQDIHNLAYELASLTKQQQRSFGAKY